MKRKHIAIVGAGGILGVCAAVITYKKITARKKAAALTPVTIEQSTSPAVPEEVSPQTPITPAILQEEVLLVPESSPEKVYQYDAQFSVVGTYDTIEDARAAVPPKYRGTVGKALRGQLLSAGGYFWSIGAKPFNLDEIPEKWKTANPLVPYKKKRTPRPRRSGHR